MILLTKSSNNKQTNKHKQTNKQNRIKLQIKQWYILPLVILMYVDKGGEYVDVDIIS
jgi:ribosomal protein S19